MSLPVMQFPILSFEQSNPGLTAASSISQTLGQILQNQQQGIKNKYLPQTLQEALKKSQYENKLLGPQAEQGQDRANYELKDLRLSPEKTLATIRQLQAETGLKGKETELKDFQVKNPLLSLTGPAAQIGAIDFLRRHPEYNGVTNPQTLSTNQGQMVGNVGGVPMSKDQINAYQQIKGEQINPQGPQQEQQKTLADMLTSSLDTTQKEKLARTNYYNVTPGIRAATNPNLLSVASTNRDVARGMANTLTEQVSPGSKASESDVDNYMKYASDMTIRRTTPNAIQTQRYYSKLADTFIDRADQFEPAFEKYLGAAGHIKKTEEGAASLFGGKSSQDFLDMNKFITNAVGAANEIRRKLGGQASDQETKIMNNLIDRDYWYSNPDVARAQWNEIKEVFGRQTGNVLALGAGDIRSSLGGKEQIPSTSQSVQGNIVTVQDPDGGMHQILSSKLNDALRKYPELKVIR